jgi:hypothetical protein
MVKMKTVVTVVALAVSVTIAPATEAPGYDPTDRVIPKTTGAFVGLLVSAVQTNEPGSHILRVSIRKQRQLWGAFTNDLFEAEYRELTIPAIPEGIGVCFVNHTGSGIEWEARTNSAYVCFLSQQTNGLSLLRLETVENATKVKAMFEDLKNRRPQPATGRSNVLAMLKADVPEAKLTVSNQEYAVVVRWLTQVEAQTCQRPLDVYLVDCRIGAFINPIQNLTLKGPSLHDLARAFRPLVEDYLKKKGIPEERVLAAKEIGGIYMKEDAEPTTPPHSKSAAPSSQR